MSDTQARIDDLVKQNEVLLFHERQRQLSHVRLLWSCHSNFEGLRR